MPRTKTTETAVDAIGRPTSNKAKRLYDAKGGGPVNYASNKKIAQRASKYVSDMLGRIESSRQFLVQRLTVFYTLWNGDSVADYFPTGRPVHCPEPFKAVEGFVPRGAALLVGSPGWFRVIGVDDAGKRNAETITKVLLAQLKKDKFYTKFRTVLRGTATYGFYPAKVRWKKKSRKVHYNELQETEPTPESPGRKLALKRNVETTINDDGPSMEPIDPLDFYVDLRFRDHQESPGLFFKQERFESDLLDLKSSGQYENIDALLSDARTENIDKIQSNGPPGTLANPGTFQDIRNASDGIAMDAYHTKAEYRLYEIYEFWGRFDPDYDAVTGKKGKEREFVITLGRKAFDRAGNGGWTVLRIVENPYWHGVRPVIVAHYIRRCHAFHSIGIIEPIVHLSAELDDSRNMALAARSLEASPPIIVGDEADIYSNNYVIEAGTIIHARNAEAARVLTMPKVSDSAFNAEDRIKRDIREVTGIVDTLQGTSDAASETATSVVNRTREANKRIDEVCKNISEEFLVPMLEQFFALDQQFLTKERTMEIVGEDGLTVDFRKISPEDVAGRVQFEITALPEIEIAGLKARMLNAFTDRAIAIEGLAPGTHRLKELSKMAWVEEFGTANVDRAFVDADAPLNPRSPLDEHELFGQGYMPDVQASENYLQHFKQHQGFVVTDVFKKWNPDHQRALLAHIRNTELRLQQEIDQASPRVPQPPMQAPAPGQPPGAGAQPGQPPRPAGAQGPMGMPRQNGVGPITTEGQVRSSAASNSPRTPKEAG